MEGSSEVKELPVNWKRQAYNVVITTDKTINQGVGGKLIVRLFVPLNRLFFFFVFYCSLEVVILREAGGSPPIFFFFFFVLLFSPLLQIANEVH